jgi:hypothetical protein
LYRNGESGRSGDGQQSSDDCLLHDKTPVKVVLRKVVLVNSV